MLQEIKDLQQRAVKELTQKINSQKKELTFKAPTGSGKTYMMADFMHRILANMSDVVFLVSTLSKSNLARQNYDAFVKYSRNEFTNLNPYLINSEGADEERISIPLDYNVYVLPRDLYKEKSKLNQQGSMISFLRTITDEIFGKNKRIYVIRDECHQATKNLDSLDNFFTKIINFSATPNLKRGQNIDIQITEEEAENVHLIKRIEFGDDSDDVEVAIKKLTEIKKDYRNLLGVNPCLIIQISNKDKADDEINNTIKPILNKIEYQDSKWMIIADKSKSLSDTNDSIKNKLPVDRWKDYAKGKDSTIDIIIFKMVISEGWDIPRACMLYQIRDTKSKQLDEQVIGRVRRNPRLLDFETLNEEAQKLASTAWVWGIISKDRQQSYPIVLCNETAVVEGIQLKTIKLANITERKDFDIKAFMNNQKENSTNKSIFESYSILSKADNELIDLCYQYSESYNMWFQFMAHFNAIKRKYNDFICDYSQSMEIEKDENGNDKLSSFAITSICIDNENYQNIANWVWMRKDGSDKFSFDSEAEREWANVLVNLSNNDKIKRAKSSDELFESKFLWGKNFLANSNIRYEYYADGIHSSYPDFIMKDTQNRIHIFEVKSVNKSNKIDIDKETYEAKIISLKECYKACSQKIDYIFYLPILKNEQWQIKRYYKGVEETISKDEFIKSL